MRFVDIRNDIAFRKIFGNENKKEILISFLNAVLKLDNQDRILAITMLNPFQFPRIKGLKVSVIDVKATDEKGNVFIVEMQLTDKNGLDKRIQYYGAKGYASQIESGDDYLKLKPMIFIGILDFEYFDNPNYISRHLIMDSETGERKFKDLEFNFIELPKFIKEPEILDNLVDKWIFFIKNSKNLEIIPENINDTGLLTAYKDAEKHNWTKEELEDYDYVLMREQDERGQTQFVVDKVIAETIIEFYKNNVSIEVIAKSTKQSIGQIKEILGIND